MFICSGCLHLGQRASNIIMGAWRNVTRNMTVQQIFNVFERHYVLLTSVTALGVGVLVLRRYFSGAVCASQERLDGKTIIITGANTGIGKETALELARRGGHVILACRDAAKAKQAAADIRQSTSNGRVTVRIVDLASFASVRKFCKQIVESGQRVDILINNAGVMWCPQQKSTDGYEMQFAVNHLGPFLLTNLLLALLKSSAPSRIINVSSSAHERAEMNFKDLNLTDDYTPQKAYCQSKLANILFTRELNRRRKGSGTSVFALHPGIVYTELGRHVDTTSFPWWKMMLLKPVIAFCFKTPWQGAQTTIHCAVAAGIEEHSGEYFSECRLKKTAPKARDEETARKLWDISAQLVGLGTQS